MKNAKFKVIRNVYNAKRERIARYIMSGHETLEDARDAAEWHNNAPLIICPSRGERFADFSVVIRKDVAQAMRDEIAKHTEQ